MKATHMQPETGRQERQLKQMSFEQRVELHKSYVANIPWWRHPLIGYLLCIPLIGAAIIGTVELDRLSDLPPYFSGSLLLLPIVLLALFWGAGPSIFAVIIGTGAFDFFIISPIGQFKFYSWQDMVHLAPIMFSGLTIALITAQRERARLEALAAEQELKMRANELEDANQMKDRFLSIASHELKTPITTIRGLSQLGSRLLKRLEAPGNPSIATDLQTVLSKIDTQSMRLTALINELMDVSRMRAGKIELRKKVTDLREICRSVVEDQSLLTERQIKLEMPPTPVKIVADSERLSQVFVNLLSNALKYSSESSPVEMSVEVYNAHVLIQVRDYGIGIAKDQQQHIFETFYRTPDAEASTKQGLGLGLAITKDIVERHNGRVWCESSLGKGSTFLVELPRK